MLSETKHLILEGDKRDLSSNHEQPKV